LTTTEKTFFFSKQLNVAKVSATNPDSIRNSITVKARNGFTPAEGILHDVDKYVVGVSYETESMWIEKQYINLCINNLWMYDVMNRDLDGLERLIVNELRIYSGRVDEKPKKRKLPDGKGASTSKRTRNTKENSCSGFGFVSAVMKWFV